MRSGRETTRSTSSWSTRSGREDGLLVLFNCLRLAYCREDLCCLLNIMIDLLATCRLGLICTCMCILTFVKVIRSVRTCV